MSLFQTSVIKKYENDLDTNLVEQKYQEFTEYFGKPDIQQHIRSVNEEQFQVHFFRELFVKILGYDLNDKPYYNLDVEFKNVNDSKKADGAILKEGKAIGVIELKSTQTTDLDKVETQAFGYKNHHPECVYVVTSNFEKLRFYVRNAVDYIEFDLFTLSSGDFKLLWLCLEKDNLLTHVPEAMKRASVLQEEDVTKKLYADYAKFREALFNNMVKNNPETDKLSLFKKTQKLLDRFLFIFFAEDRLLVPPNSITQIIEKWEDDVAFGDDKPLYDLFKQYFRVLNQGRPQRGNRPAIFAYNGGLFKPDDLLDSVKIDDDVLKAHSLNLSAYDFETDIDVNILGHIFEHSIGEIESVQAEIKGETQDKTKSRRKKEGVFYTPKYITQYIVENTVGKLCEEKRDELGIVDEEYTKGRKNRKKTKLKELLAKLDAYREWLLQLTILDPACGSGAFLNQAVDFLIKEHGKIDELRANLLDESLMLSDITNDILENNIYGVDINDESVEIAKLSLWLRTAAKGRKLNTLSDNIKCGNSLINDPEVAGEKAFNWNEEFPEVFKKGGFDVVIGNPPYVHLEKIRETSNALRNTNYKTYHSQGDIYAVFVEKGINVLQKNGLISYIMPNKWLQAGYGKPLRKYILRYRMIELIDFGDIQIFQDATTYPCIFLMRKEKPQEKLSISVLKESKSDDFRANVSITAESFDINSFDDSTWFISSKKENSLLYEIAKRHKTLNEVIGGQAYRGILTGLSQAFIIDKSTKSKLVEADPKSVIKIKPFLQGRDLKRYSPAIPSNYLIMFEKGETRKENDSDEKAEDWLKINYPSIENWLIPYKEKAKKRTDKGDYWWELRACDYYSLFEKPKIMYQKFQVKPCFIFDEHGLYCNDSMWIIPTENKSLVGVLNSKMGWWLITKYCSQIQNGYQLIWKYFGEIPVPEHNIPGLTELVDRVIEKTMEKELIVNSFVQHYASRFAIEKPSKRLHNWQKLDFQEFLKELKKQKVKLSLNEESEWMQYFNEQKQKAQDLQQQIDQTDREIDQMVYELYGLSDEEIKIVEESVG